MGVVPWRRVWKGRLRQNHKEPQIQVEGLTLYPGRDSEPLKVLGRADTIRPVFYLFVFIYLF